jgi:hypothetical protein
LNPKVRPGHHHGKDGLTIFDTSTAECLHSKAVRTYPKTHPDFLSFNGNVNLNISALCKRGFSELIPREDNRIIIINDRDINKDMQEGKFETETMMAVVIKLSYI